MRYLFAFPCVCALTVVPLVGCSETSPNLCEGVECDDDNECTNDVCDPAVRATTPQLTMAQHVVMVPA
ncbi:MAG: hypothetical protein EP303_02890 [Deltaproteobacteria bacterium]|nr:MAG: hypothetical protein EP303_02890 [Deltaproteobacteria bacterium]